MPTAGADGDYAEVKDNNANVLSYHSSIGEFVAQYGLALGAPTTFTANGAVPAAESNVEIGTIAASIALTLPAASAVTPGHILSIRDANGTVSSSATVSLQTPTAGGKIGAVSAATASTSAASYAFMNASYAALRLISNGTNWGPI